MSSEAWSGVIACTKRQLNLDVTLSCGQSFRWRKNEHGEWSSTFASRVWVLKQDSEGNLMYKVLKSNTSGCQSNHALATATGSRKRRANGTLAEGQAYQNHEDNEMLLRDYFQLQVDVENLYQQWSAADMTFRKIALGLLGVRVLRQEPFEALMAFICSSNNNIKRISSMVNKLCENYGTKLLDASDGGFYAFPTAHQLDRDCVEQELKAMGFGYRAKYIRATARALALRGPQWLYLLREVPYSEAHQQLIQLPGVGAKVADCVCLMALDKMEAVPVDVHLYKLAVQHYLPHLSGHKTLTSRDYHQVGNFFRERFGPYAGWAQSVLFTSDLKEHSKERPLS